MCAKTGAKNEGYELFLIRFPLLKTIAKFDKRKQYKAIIYIFEKPLKNGCIKMMCHILIFFRSINIYF